MCKMCRKEGRLRRAARRDTQKLNENQDKIEELMSAGGLKQACDTCGTLRNIGDFPLNTTGAGPHVRITTCVICLRRKDSFLQQYGLTRDRYNEMVKTQGNTCAICGQAPQGKKALCIDHCHTTGKVRGLLCVGCNVGLGYFKDNTAYMTSAIAYLTRTYTKNDDVSAICRD